MGRRGPPPQPTKLRILKGNPGKRPLNEREPKLASQVPSCPRWLNLEAKREWRDVVSLLKAMKILTRVDRDALTAYCQTYARWKAAEQFLDKHGEVYPVRDEQGNVRCMQQFPQVSIARNLLQVLRSCWQEFGMTPSARTRVHAFPDEVDDPEDVEFFGPSRGPWK